MKAIEDLGAAYAVVTPGAVRLDGHCVVKDEEGTFVVFADCGDELKPEAQGVADARLIALMKNNLPALIECAKALEDVRWALRALASEACDIAEFHPEINDNWNEGGVAYEAMQKVKAALAKLENAK